jgi:hypothetical protein
MSTVLTSAGITVKVSCEKSMEDSRFQPASGDLENQVRSRILTTLSSTISSRLDFLGLSKDSRRSGLKLQRRFSELATCRALFVAAEWRWALAWR